MSDDDTSTSDTERKCEMPECSTRGVKACRDPEDNLLDLCESCRREWPVEVVES